MPLPQFQNDEDTEQVDNFSGSDEAEVDHEPSTGSDREIHVDQGNHETTCYYA